ncbi:MAG: chromosome partitioning protein [Gammaproteobacteria bacterium]|jgi:chromosome partitioning protein
MPARCVALLNQKGGVGKTTTSVNLASIYAAMGIRVLAVDIDPQSHFSISLGLTDRDLVGIDNIFLEGHKAEPYIRNIRENLDLLPAGYRLSEVEKMGGDGPRLTKVLRDALEPVKNNYQYIIIDCPPVSGLLNFNALFASDEVIVPVSSDYLALQGLSQLLRTLRSAQKYMKKPIEVWLVLTRYSSRRNLSKEVKQKLIDYFPNRLLMTAVRESAPVAESPSFGMSVVEYSPRSNGAKDYLNLADDFINRRVMRV